jgi:hypothetical protein
MIAVLMVMSDMGIWLGWFGLDLVCLNYGMQQV